MSCKNIKLSKFNEKLRELYLNDNKISSINVLSNVNFKELNKLTKKSKY